MKVIPAEKTIKDILSGNKQLLIPRFQREYSWDSKNYKEFLYDMIENFSINKGKLTVSPYFLGTMLFVGNMNDETIKEIKVVDGQQRLTTITILFSVLAQLLYEQGEKDLGERVFKYVMSEDDDGAQVRILKTFTSYPYFSCYIQEIGKEHPVEATTEEEKSIENAYNFFYKELSEKNYKKLIFSRTGVEIKNLDYINFLKLLRDQVLSSTIVLITTLDDKEANKIFEILNAKGSHLTFVDLIKNELFRVEKATEPSDYAFETWKNIKAELSSRDDIIGMATFFMHYWSSTYSRSTKATIYSNFKKTIKEDQYNSFLIDLYKNAKEYNKIANPRLEDYKNRKEYTWLVQSLKTLSETFNVTQVRVAILALNDALKRNVISKKDYKSVIKYLENFHFVYNALLAYSPNKLDPIYSKFAINLRKCETKEASRAVLKGYLYEPIERIFPSFDEFEKGFLKLTYAKNSSPENMKARYVINQLNSYYDSTEYWANDGSIEHIVPEDDRPISLSIGNLILLEQDINSNIGEQPYHEKKVDYEKSKYKWINDFVKNNISWDETMIIDRAHQMAKIYYKNIIGK